MFQILMMYHCNRQQQKKQVLDNKCLPRYLFRTNRYFICDQSGKTPRQHTIRPDQSFPGLAHYRNQRPERLCPKVFRQVCIQLKSWQKKNQTETTVSTQPMLGKHNGIMSTDAYVMFRCFRNSNYRSGWIQYGSIPFTVTKYFAIISTRLMYEKIYHWIYIMCFSKTNNFYFWFYVLSIIYHNTLY